MQSVRYLIALSLLCITSCAAGQQLQPPKPKLITPADLQKLRWLEGTWRGSANGQEAFYERYRFASDTTIETDYFGRDQTLTKIKGKGTVTILNGSILHLNDSGVWIATAVDDKSVRFEPKEKAHNSFTWEKESSDVWIARLKYSDPQGNQTETVYRMERVKQ